MVDSRRAYELAFCIGLFLLAACSPTGRAAVPTLVAVPEMPTVQCKQEEVLPKIEEVRPVEIPRGSEVTVTASGGYLRDDCGGYNESSRLYKLYLDDEPIADLPCYVNHCETKFVVPESIALGQHCLGVQKGTCQMELRVTGE